MKPTLEELFNRQEELEKRMRKYESGSISMEAEQRINNDYSMLKQDFANFETKEDARHEKMDNFLWKDEDSVNTRLNNIHTKQEESMKYNARMGKANIALNSIILALIGIMLTSQLNSKAKEVQYISIPQYTIPTNGTQNVPYIPNVNYPNKEAILPNGGKEKK